MPITAFDSWQLAPRREQPHPVTDFARYRGDDFIRAVLDSPTMWPDAAPGVRPEYHQAQALAHLYEGTRPLAEPGGRAPSWFLTRDPRKLAEIARYVVAHTPNPRTDFFNRDPTATFQMRDLPPGFIGRVIDSGIERRDEHGTIQVLMVI